MSDGHDTEIVWVKAHVDCGVADLVRSLNVLDGVMTHASCEGDERVAAHAMVTCERHELLSQWDVEQIGEALYYVYRDGVVAPQYGGALYARSA